MKKLNLIDIIIILGILIALVVGFVTMKHFRQTADKQIEATSPISFQVFLRGVTVTGEDFPIKQNESTFITIRNVPYTELKVLDVQSSPRMTAINNELKSDKYTLIKDPSQPALYDAIVLITDVAKITKDGAVVGGNKIKMGLPVTLEGKNYKFNGTISDVKLNNTQNAEDVNTENQIG